jgi:hypothetical protein
LPPGVDATLGANAISKHVVVKNWLDDIELLWTLRDIGGAEAFPDRKSN